MSVHTVIESEAKEQLSELIDRALNGEEIRIASQRGRTIELKAVPQEPDLPTSINDIDWLRRHSVGRIDPHLDSAQIIRRMRDAGY